MRYEGD
jgi:hypothetical protein